jgi:hypothetical protein
MDDERCARCGSPSHSPNVLSLADGLERLHSELTGRAEELRRAFEGA